MSFTSCLEKPRADLTHEPTHLAQVTGAIGAASGIAKEDERLLGQALMDGARHRETAKTESNMPIGALFITPLS